MQYKTLTLLILIGCGSKLPAMSGPKFVQIIGQWEEIPDCDGGNSVVYYNEKDHLFNQCQEGKIRVINDAYEALSMRDAFDCNGTFEPGIISESRIKYNYSVYELGDGFSIISCGAFHPFRQDSRSKNLQDICPVKRLRSFSMHAFGKRGHLLIQV
jgi:hypothetical protein